MLVVKVTWYICLVVGSYKVQVGENKFLSGPHGLV